MNSYVVFDLETTGFSTDTCEIIEIGAIKVENNIVVSAFDELIKPQFYIPRNIQLLTGITPERVQNSASLEEVLGRFYEYVGDLPLLGYNLPFDWGFLKAKGLPLGFDFTRKGQTTGIDVLNLCRKYYTVSSYKLADIAKYLNINPSIEGAYHSAYYDAYVTYIIYVTLLNTYGAKTDIVTPRLLLEKDDNRKYGKVVNFDALSLD